MKIKDKILSVIFALAILVNVFVAPYDNSLMLKVSANKQAETSSGQGWLFPSESKIFWNYYYDYQQGYKSDKASINTNRCTKKDCVPDCWYHNGIDIGSATGNGGDKIYATRSGYIVYADNKTSTDRTKNKRIGIAHYKEPAKAKSYQDESKASKNETPNYYSHYYHLKQIDVKVGQWVEQGDVIGLMGNTGDVRPTTAYHLHFFISIKNSSLTHAKKDDSNIVNTNPKTFTIDGNKKITHSGGVVPLNDKNKTDSNGITYTFIPKKTSTAEPLPKPTGLKAVKKTETSATISWDKVTGATSYEVQFYSRSKNAWVVDTDYKTKTATSYVSTGYVSQYTSYQYRVRAVNSGGNSSWATITYYTVPFTVTLNKNGGIGGTSSVKATYNENMPSITIPTKTGYKFAGYYDTSATTGGTQYYTSTGASSRTWNKTTDTPLYARWTAETDIIKCAVCDEETCICIYCNDCNELETDCICNYCDICNELNENCNCPIYCEECEQLENECVCCDCMIHIDIVDGVIEISNVSDNAISTKGLYLTDDETDLYKWQMPAIIIQSNGSILVKSNNDNITRVLKRAVANFEIENYVMLVNANGDILDTVSLG